MKASAGQKVRTGIFTFVGIFILVGGIFLIGKTKNLFGNTFHIYGTFKSVGGLQTGNNIRFAGVNVGTVESVQIINDTEARVDMVLVEKVHQFIKANSLASIGSDGLMGDKLINISATAPDNDLIKDGARIATVDPGDMGKIMAQVQRIADNAEIITDGLAGIATQISEGKGSLGRLLYSDNLAKNLEGTVSSMKKGTQGFSENMQALKGNFLLRGYYKRKERKKEEAAEKGQEAQQAQQPQTTPPPPADDDRKSRRKKKHEQQQEQK